MEAKEEDTRLSDALSATAFLREKFPQVDIKFDDDFEGMEKSVVFNLTNGSIASSPSIIPLSLTRANNHLVIFIQDFRDIFMDASKLNLVKVDPKNLPIYLAADQNETGTSTGLQEASSILASQSTKISLDSMAKLAKEWGIEALYQQLLKQNKTRWQMINMLTQEIFKTRPSLTLADFMDSLGTVNMMNCATRVPLTRTFTMRDVVAEKLKLNLEQSIDDLKSRITARNLTDNEQIELAQSLGQRNLFNLLTRPLDPKVIAVADQHALVTCVDTWGNQATEHTSTEELINCLLKSGLIRIAAQIKEKLENPTANYDIASFANFSIRERMGTTAFDIFLPIFCIISTVVFLVLLFCNIRHAEFWTLLVMHWVPGAGFFGIHLYYNQSYYGPILSKFYMALLLLFQLIGSTVLYILYIMKRVSSTGGAVDRYKMKKILQLAESSMLMNNFTSLMIATYSLQLWNEGRISMNNPAIFSMFIITVGLHMLKLGTNILKKQGQFSVGAAAVKCFPVMSSLLVKAIAILLLLSADSYWGPLYGLATVSLAFSLNYWIEKKFVSTETEDQEINMTWMRTAHSLIYPLEHELPTKNVNLGKSLQLLLGDFAALACGLTVNYLAEITKGLFLTHNMVMALGVTGVGLTLYASTASYVISLWNAPASSLNDNLYESDNNVTETSSLLGNNQNQTHLRQRKTAMVALLVPISFVLMLASPFPLLLYAFNTCATFQSQPNGHITCTNFPPIVGSQCRLSCAPLFWSSSSLHSQCTWRGVWSLEDLTCRNQVAAVVGPRHIVDQDSWVSAVEIYPAPGMMSSLPGMPRLHARGAVAYINGGLLYCGGVDLEDPSVPTVSSCQLLKPPVAIWKRTSPLLQVICSIFSTPSITSTYPGKRDCLQCCNRGGWSALGAGRVKQRWCALQHPDS